MAKHLSLLFALAAPFSVSATFRVLCSRLALANMDPIVTNGTRSGHQHDIIGSLAFDVQINEAKQRAALSTCSIVGDFSNYWTPSVFQTIVVDGVQTSVALTPYAQAAYYLFGASDIPKINTTVFNKPLAMVLGDSSGNATKTKNVFSHCVQPGAPGIYVTAKASTGWVGTFDNCADIRFEYSFPTCWNGGPYASNQSHTAYARVNRDGTKDCPASHPNRLPQLHIQYNYWPYNNGPVSWTNGNAPFTLSSGGGSVQSMHADAVLLWDETVFKALLQNCPSLKPGDCKPSSLGVTANSPQVQQAIAAQYTVPSPYV